MEIEFLMRLFDYKTGCLIIQYMVQEMIRFSLKVWRIIRSEDLKYIATMYRMQFLVLTL